MGRFVDLNQNHPVPEAKRIMDRRAKSKPVKILPNKKQIADCLMKKRKA